MEDNHIYQFSLLNALMDGVSETGITASKLASKGNQGLGTFSRMNGELLLLDGKVYQLQAEGNVREAGPEDQIPFAVSTNFVPQQTKQVPFHNKDDIERALDGFNDHATNLFMTYRIKGKFEYLKCRTVRGQQFKGESLKELGKRQSVEEYQDVEGTIIGFRTPKVSVPMVVLSCQDCYRAIEQSSRDFANIKLELARLRRRWRTSALHKQRSNGRRACA